MGQCCRCDPRMSNEVREEVGYRDRYSQKSSFRKVCSKSSCKFDGIVHYGGREKLKEYMVYKRENIYI